MMTISGHHILEQQDLARSSTCYDSTVTPGLLVVLIFLVIFRVTRLVIEDTFPPIGVPRKWLLNYWDPDVDWWETHPDAKPHWDALGRSLRYLFSCPWCMSIWLGPVIIWVTMQWYDVPAPVLVWLGGSAVTGLLAGLEEKLS